MSRSVRRPVPTLRVLVAQLLLCVLLLGQLVPANLLPRAWSQESQWAAMGLCTTHGETGDPASQRSNPEDCCSMPCCHPAPAPQAGAFHVQSLRLAWFGWPIPAGRQHPADFVTHRSHPPRAPPFFGLV